MATTSINRKNTSLVRSGKSRANNRTREAFRSTDRNPYAFLNEPIKEIACSDIASEYFFDDAISWESNLHYLEASARKWCELHGKPYEVSQSSNPLTQMMNIFDALTKLTDEYRFDLDFDPTDKMLKLIEYRYCDFPDYTVFYLPVKSINEFESKDMRDLLVCFYSFIYHETLFLMPEESFDFCMLLEVPYEDGEGEYYEEMVQSVESYKKRAARELFSEIMSVPPAKRSSSAIKSMISGLSEADRRHNEDLINIIEKGLELTLKDDLRNHSYFEGYCSDERFDARWDGDFIMPERMFVFCYENDDELASSAMHAFSEEANNMEILYFRDGRHLSPDDKEIFEASTYPREWADWFGNLMDILNHE